MYSRSFVLGLFASILITVSGRQMPDMPKATITAAAQFEQRAIGENVFGTYITDNSCQYLFRRFLALF